MKMEEEICVNEQLRDQQRQDQEARRRILHGLNRAERGKVLFEF